MTVNVPVAAALPADSVNALVVMAGLGMNEAVTPLGKPEADRLTLPLNPFMGVTVIVVVAPVPCAMLKLPVAAERPKSAEGTTVTPTVVVAVKLPDVPATVTEKVPLLAVALAVMVSTVLL